jgi:hypothetical protein
LLLQDVAVRVLLRLALNLVLLLAKKRQRPKGWEKRVRVLALEKREAMGVALALSAQEAVMPAPRTLDPKKGCWASA